MKKDIVKVKWVDQLGRIRKAELDRNSFEYYPADMDKDMVSICDALNSMRGVRTFFCCSGHGRGNPGDFYILFGVSSMPSLKAIVKAFGETGRKTPDGFSPYTVETDARFWALKDRELGVRVSNQWVDCLDDRRRKLEFTRLTRLLRKGGR